MLALQGFDERPKALQKTPAHTEDPEHAPGQERKAEEEDDRDEDSLDDHATERRTNGCARGQVALPSRS